MIADLQEDFKKNNKIIENYGIKFYFYNSIFKEFLSKYETKTINFLKDNYKLIISND